MFAWLECFERWRIDTAYRLLRCIYSHEEFEYHWYPQILIMQIDENPEWLVDCQKLIAVAEWIKDGAASNIVAILCEGHTQDPDTGEYLRSVETAVTQLIGESCLNAHHLVVSYENLSELNETASAVTQCSGLGILKPNTIIIDFPKCGTSSDFLYAGQSELWNRIAATVDKCLLICKGDLWKPVPFNLATTLDLWWVVESDDLLLSFISVICRNYRWTFTKLRIFAVIRETEVEIVKDQISKRIHQASLTADSIQLRPVLPDDIVAYESAKLPTIQSIMKQNEQTKSRMLYKSEPPLGLNNLIRNESNNADLIIVNLPRPRGDMPASRLLQSLDAITEHLTRVVIFRPPAY
uniref:SLC12A transporter C-terminal domain-containing protein n=1 Tax=Setaria digitata TaxID=48799 RepID=A0A915PWQ2_9BILA